MVPVPDILMKVIVTPEIPMLPSVTVPAPEKGLAGTVPVKFSAVLVLLK